MNPLIARSETILKIIKSLSPAEVVITVPPQEVYQHFGIHEASDGRGWLVCDATGRPAMCIEKCRECPTIEQVRVAIDQFRALKFH